MVEIQKLLAPDINLLHSNSCAVRMSRHSSTSPTFSLSSFGHVCSIGTTAFLALFTTPPKKKKILMFFFLTLLFFIQVFDRSCFQKISSQPKTGLIVLALVI